MATTPQRQGGQTGSLRPSPTLPDDPPAAIAEGAAADRRWRLESLPLRPLEPVLAAADGRVLNGFEYTVRDGTFYLERWEPVARLTSRRDQRIVLPSAGLHHIQRMHDEINGTSPFAPGVSVKALLHEIAGRLPDAVIYEHREARLDFELDRVVGEDAVESAHSLLERGAVSEAELEVLEPHRAEIARCNLNGTKAEKAGLRERLNELLSGTRVRIVRRRDSLVRQVDAPRLTTRWVAMVVFGDSQRQEAEPVGEIRTLYPGRIRPPLPAAEWFFRHYGADRAGRGLAVLEKVRSGEPLEKTYERVAAERFGEAQEFWEAHAFVQPGAGE